MYLNSLNCLPNSCEHVLNNPEDEKISPEILIFWSFIKFITKKIAAIQLSDVAFNFALILLKL
jgi:hypothetical protein